MDDWIANAELRADDIPIGPAGWGDIAPFALTFDGYDYCGSFEACADLAERCATAYAERRCLPESLSELRTCLFWEQRCAHWSEPGEGDEDMTYVHALLEAIRRKALAGETE